MHNTILQVSNIEIQEGKFFPKTYSSRWQPPTHLQIHFMAFACVTSYKKGKNKGEDEQSPNCL